jgi:hypothetical protein
MSAVIAGEPDAEAQAFAQRQKPRPRRNRDAETLMNEEVKKTERNEGAEA